jgi:glycine/D-amino acid oxidase-like deaminating enzyme
MKVPSAHHNRKRPSAAPNQSFWLDAIETEGLQPPLEGDREADVVLIGGGYTSLVTAYCLKKQRPELELALLESSYVGFGSSGRNAGMVLHDSHVERVPSDGERAVRFTYDETVGVADWIENVAREEGFDCELERTGYFDIAFHPAHLRRIENLEARAREIGIGLRLLSRDEIRERLHSQRFIGALYHPRAAMLHPGKYVAGLKRAVLKAGVRVYEQTRVTDTREGREILVRTEGGSVRARELVLGLNAYLPGSGLGVVRDRAVSLFSFIILTEPLSDALWKEVGWQGREGYSDSRRVHNYVRLTGKRILFGGRVLYHFGVDSPRRMERVYLRLYEELVQTFPCLEGVAISHRWAGPVALTWRRTPVIGRAGKGRNIYSAFGYSGMGVSLGTLSGRVLADLVLGSEARWNELLYLDDGSWPLPPEPFRFLGFQGSYYAMRFRDLLERISSPT